MTICLGFHSGDHDLARRLLQWITRLGACPRHRLILVSDAGCPWQAALAVHLEALKAFPDGVDSIDNGTSVKGWPQGPNSLFLTAAKYVQKKRLGYWLWLEPDAVPIKSDWATWIANGYEAADMPFYGCIIENDTGRGVAGVSRYVNGVAVYPENAIELGGFIAGPQAWDIAAAARVVPQTHHTPLIQVFWGEQGQPPTFVPDSRSSIGLPKNALRLNFIKPEAVLFHRNPDLSLIRLLWEKSFPATLPREPFVVVLPFHNGDGPAAIKMVQWIGKLLNGEAPRYDAVLAYEGPRVTIGPFIQAMQTATVAAFRNVRECIFPKAPSPKWPNGANWAFQHVAQFMASSGLPWLWMEPDMIPLVPTWLDMLQTEYAHCGKPVMGSPVVQWGGHINGTAVYPADILERCPTLKNIPDGQAFDTFAKECINSMAHNAGHLMAHIWGIHEGKPHPFTGTHPHFTTQREIEAWVPRGAVTLHRCKDGSLIDRLTEMYKA